MKSKPFVIIIISLVICATALLYNQYGIFSRYNYFTAQWDKTHNRVRLLAYGKRLITSSQRAEIAHKMGFSIYTIAGCEISAADINGADQYNKVMKNALNKISGKNWQVKFDKLVDSLFRIQRAPQMYQAVMNQRNVQELMAKRSLFKPDSICVKLTNLTDLDVTHPNAWLYIKRNNKLSIFSYYRVNPYNLGVVQIMY